MTLKRDIGDARVYAAQVERYRHRRWWKAVRASLRRLPWKRARQASRRDIERGGEA